MRFENSYKVWEIAYVVDTILESSVIRGLFESCSSDTKRPDLSILELSVAQNQKLLPQKVLEII